MSRQKRAKEFFKKAVSPTAPSTFLNPLGRNPIGDMKVIAGIMSDFAEQECERACKEQREKSPKTEK